MTTKEIILLMVGGIIGFGASLLASAFTQPFLHWFYSRRSIRKICYWSSVLNTQHKMIHKCSSIQRCNLKEFSAMCSEFVSSKYSSLTDKKYVIFNTLDPKDFYERIKNEFSDKTIFIQFENAVKVRDYALAKSKVNELFLNFSISDINDFKHLVTLRDFGEKFRIQFFNFDINNQADRRAYTANNKLFHFIFYSEFINKDVICVWSYSKTPDGDIGIDGIIINDTFLFEFNSSWPSLFYAKDSFNNYNQKEDSIEPFYNKYISLLSNRNTPIFIHNNIIGEKLYGVYYKNYLTA